MISFLDEMTKPVLNISAADQRETLEDIRVVLESMRAQLELCQRGLAVLAARRVSEAEHARDAAIDRIVQAVSVETGINARRILGKQRLAEVCEARFLVYWLIHETLPLSLNETAEQLNLKCHATIAHGIERIRSLIETEPKTAARAQRLLEQCGTRNAECGKETHE